MLPELVSVEPMTDRLDAALTVRRFRPPPTPKASAVVGSKPKGR